MIRTADALGDFESKTARLTRERELILERRARWLNEATDDETGYIPAPDPFTPYVIPREYVWDNDN
ncbi:MAG: hypothetical protein AAF441_25745 [Pseudomonadota bacterium]